MSNITVEEAIMKELVDRLDPVEDEVLINRVMTRHHKQRDEIKYEINELHYANKIRWVAMRGWMAGGRPE